MILEDDLNDAPLKKSSLGFDDKMLAIIRNESQEEDDFSEIESILQSFSLMKPSERLNDNIDSTLLGFEDFSEIEEQLDMPLRAPSKQLDERVRKTLKPIIVFSDLIWTLAGVAAIVVIGLSLMKLYAPVDTAPEKTISKDYRNIKPVGKIKRVVERTSETYGFEEPIYMDGIPYKQEVEKKVTKEKYTDPNSGITIIITRPKSKTIYKELPLD